MKIQITLLTGEWFWVGELTAEQLTNLCDFADQLSDGLSGRQTITPQNIKGDGK